MRFSYGPKGKELVTDRVNALDRRDALVLFARFWDEFPDRVELCIGDEPRRGDPRNLFDGSCVSLLLEILGQVVEQMGMGSHSFEDGTHLLRWQQPADDFELMVVRDDEVIWPLGRRE